MMFTLVSRPRAFMMGAALCVALAIPAPIAGAAESNDGAQFTSQRIALGGEGGFGNYRIPAVVQLNNGEILVAYDGRPTGIDAPGPNSIMQRISADGGKTFAPQTEIAAGQKQAPIHGYSDPSYVYDSETGDLFAFFVYSKDTGFWNSAEGNDDADRKVMSASVATSHDNGRTWSLRSVTHIVKPEGVRATFASSGHGIQVKQGKYKGRLVQQYAGAFTDGTVRAYSVYSDDRGATWHMGTPVGTKMDENKVVELSDGTLMMNSRVHDTHSARWVSYSTDGGQTWSEPELDYTLTDPRNNASIIRMNPDAAPGSRGSKELLFSNANSAKSRSNGSLRYSCDDGKTWPVVKTFKQGATSYSDLVALKNGSFGVAFEAEKNEQRYGSFNREYVNPFCAHFAAATGNVDAGKSTTVSFTIRNDDDHALPAGKAGISLPQGWTAPVVSTPSLRPGASAKITLRVTAPAWAAKGVTRGDVTVKAGNYSLRGDLEMTVVKAAPAALGATITGAPTDTGRNLSTHPYNEGDDVPYRFRIESTASVAQTVWPVSGNFSPLVPEGKGNCRWRDLPAGDGYNCSTPRHTVTKDDAERGYFIPQSEWELRAEGLKTRTVSVTGGEVSVRERRPMITATRTRTATFIVKNTGNVRLDTIRLRGRVVASNVGVGESVRVRTIFPHSIEASNGSLTVRAKPTK